MLLNSHTTTYEIVFCKHILYMSEKGEMPYF
jgi:hypothetical protein